MLHRDLSEQLSAALLGALEYCPLVLTTSEGGVVMCSIMGVLKSGLTGPMPQTRTSTSTRDIVDLRDIVREFAVQ